MNALARALRVHLNSEPLDAWLSRWGCALGGLGIPALAAALRRHAASRAEFLLGAMAAAVACALLVLLGRSRLPRTTGLGRHRACYARFCSSRPDARWYARLTKPTTVPPLHMPRKYTVTK